MPQTTPAHSTHRTILELSEHLQSVTTPSEFSLGSQMESCVFTPLLPQPGGDEGGAGLPSAISTTASKNAACHRCPLTQEVHAEHFGDHRNRTLIDPLHAGFITFSQIASLINNRFFKVVNSLDPPPLPELSSIPTTKAATRTWTGASAIPRTKLHWTASLRSGACVLLSAVAPAPRTRPVTVGERICI